MIASVMLMTAIVGFLAVCCFGVGSNVNPTKKEETKKSPEQKFGEALTEYVQYLKYLEPKKEEANK